MPTPQDPSTLIEISEVPRTLPERISRRINVHGPVPTDPSRPLSTPCWIWVGGKFPAGYGSVWIDRKNRLVHQVVYEAATGYRSDRQTFIDHVCRVRACCNPGHLEPVSPAVNMHRAQSKYCRRGHEMTPENTGPVKGKPYQRVCRACSREKSQRYLGKRAA